MGLERSKLNSTILRAPCTARSGNCPVPVRSVLNACRIPFAGEADCTGLDLEATGRESQLSARLC